MNGKTVTAYLCHPIRGLKGNAATREEMEANDAKASIVGAMLGLHFPELDIYIPGEHDRFPQACLDKGYLTIEQVLDADVAIMLSRDLLLVYNPDAHISGGMQIEIDAARKVEKPVITFVDISAHTITRIADTNDKIKGVKE